MKRPSGERTAPPAIRVSPLDVELQGRVWTEGRSLVRPPSRMRPITRILKGCEYFCLGVALACLGTVALSYTRAGIFQAYEGWRFNQMLKGQPLSRPGESATERGTYRAPVPLISGSVLGRIEIPRIGLSVMVLQGDDDGVLRKGAGHVPDTAYPGGAGNVVIAAHRDTFFRPLRNIREGDEISVTTIQGVHRYRVGLIEKVDPYDVQVLRALGHPTLTLITCYPFEFIGHAPKRFIVQASEILSAASQLGETLPAPPAPQKAPAVRESALPERAAIRRRPRRPQYAHARSPALTVARHPSAAESSSAFVKESPEAPTTASPLPPSNSADPPDSPIRSRVQTERLVTPRAATPLAQQTAMPAPVPSRTRKLLRKVRGWLSLRRQPADLQDSKP